MLSESIISLKSFSNILCPVLPPASWQETNIFCLYVACLIIMWENDKFVWTIIPSIIIWWSDHGTDNSFLGFDLFLQKLNAALKLGLIKEPNEHSSIWKFILYQTWVTWTPTCTTWLVYLAYLNLIFFLFFLLFFLFFHFRTKKEKKRKEALVVYNHLWSIYMFWTSILDILTSSFWEWKKEMNTVGCNYHIH